VVETAALSNLSLEKTTTDHVPKQYHDEAMGALAGLVIITLGALLYRFLRQRAMTTMSSDSRRRGARAVRGDADPTSGEEA
jgi:hypothetical protein